MAATVIDHVLSAPTAHQLAVANPLVRFIDVRTPGEHESLHIEGAYNVPLDRLAEHAEELCSNLADPVILVCQTGVRASKANQTLSDAGMTSLHLLEGGVNAWVALGLPIVKGTKRMSLERQVRILAGSLVGIGALLSLLVHPLWALIPFFIGSGLAFAGITDTCGMGMVLAKLPYNSPASCDVDLIVRQLTEHGTAESFGPAAT